MEHAQPFESTFQEIIGIPMPWLPIVFDGISFLLHTSRFDRHHHGFCKTGHYGSVLDLVSSWIFASAQSLQQ